MEDDDLPLQGLGRFLRAGSDGQGEHHRKSQQQGQEFLSLHSVTSSSFRGGLASALPGVIIPQFFQIESAKFPEAGNFFRPPSAAGNPAGSVLYWFHQQRKNGGTPNAHTV